MEYETFSWKSLIKGGVAPSVPIKLLDELLHIGSRSLLSSKNQYSKPCKRANLARIAQLSISKVGMSLCKQLNIMGSFATSEKNSSKKTI